MAVVTERNHVEGGGANSASCSGATETSGSGFGTADGCVIVETACLPTCTTREDCRAKGYSRCSEGLCRTRSP